MQKYVEIKNTSCLPPIYSESTINKTQRLDIKFQQPLAPYYLNVIKRRKQQQRSNPRQKFNKTKMLLNHIQSNSNHSKLSEKNSLLINEQALKNINKSIQKKLAKKQLKSLDFEPKYHNQSNSVTNNSNNDKDFQSTKYESKLKNLSNEKNNTIYHQLYQNIKETNYAKKFRKQKYTDNNSIEVKSNNLIEKGYLNKLLTTVQPLITTKSVPFDEKKSFRRNKFVVAPQKILEIPIQNHDEKQSNSSLIKFVNDDIEIIHQIEETEKNKKNILENDNIQQSTQQYFKQYDESKEIKSKNQIEIFVSVAKQPNKPIRGQDSDPNSFEFLSKQINQINQQNYFYDFLL